MARKKKNEETKSKFNVNKDKLNRTYNGIVFASEMEMKYYRDVVLVGLEDGSIISNKMQVKYELVPEFYHKGTKYNSLNYVSDFNLTYSDGTELVVDVKGLVKPIDICHRKMLLYKYPSINFVWLTLSLTDGGWCTYEQVQKGRAKRRKEKKAKEKLEGGK
jgi:hypothetical protein